MQVLGVVNHSLLETPYFKCCRGAWGCRVCSTESCSWQLGYLAPGLSTSKASCTAALVRSQFWQGFWIPHVSIFSQFNLFPFVLSIDYGIQWKHGLYNFEISWFVFKSLMQSIRDYVQVIFKIDIVKYTFSNTHRTSKIKFMTNTCNIDMLKSSSYTQMWLNVEIICDDANDNEKWKCLVMDFYQIYSLYLTGPPLMEFWVCSKRDLTKSKHFQFDSFQQPWNICQANSSISTH